MFTAELGERALAAPAARIPPATFVAPANVLEPVSVRVPLSISTGPGPANVPSNVFGVLLLYDAPSVVLK